MPNYILIIIAFLLPFLLFLFLPLWRHKRSEGSFFLLIVAVFLWAIAILSITIYGVLNYILNIPLHYLGSYGLAVIAAIFILIAWVLIKKWFKIR